MGFIDDIDIKKTSASFYNKTITITNGVPDEDYNITADLTVSGVFWVGSAADRLVSDKIRPDVSGVFVFNYSDYSTTINENAKCTINGVDYSVIYAEDVGMQNEIIQVPLKKFVR